MYGDLDRFAILNRIYDMEVFPENWFFKTVPVQKVTAVDYLYKLTQLKECYIFDRLLRETEYRRFSINDADVLRWIRNLLNGVEQKLYRGIGRWHPTWNEIKNGNNITSTGNGAYPEYTAASSRTKYIPFSTDKNIATLFAGTKRGSHLPNEDIENIPGYNEGGNNFIIGVIVSVTARQNTSLGIFNIGEIQVAGPITNYTIEGVRHKGDTQLHIATRMAIANLEGGPHAPAPVILL